VLLFVCSAPLIMAVPDVFPALENSSAFVQVGILAFSWMISVIVLILLAVYWKPLKPLGLTIQRDWTQLSFATTILIAWLFIDPDDDPSLAVWLPALLIFVAAVGYMRSRTRAQELLALAGSLGTMVLVGLLYRDWYYAIFTLQIALAVLLPALLLLRERSARLPAT
jgi:membrane-associated HD superfamily phosphohydrolase